MENYYYKCEYCGMEYLPTRRHIQRFCKTACRVRANQEKKKLEVKEQQKTNAVTTEVDTTTQKTDKISLAGVANATLGVGVVELAKKILIPLENKPATKGDINALEKKLTTRYHHIANLSSRNDGAIPYFDIKTNKVVYFMPAVKTLKFT